MAGALNCMISSTLSHADLLTPYKKLKGSCWKCRPWFVQQLHDGYGRRKHAIVAAAASSSSSSSSSTTSTTARPPPNTDYAYMENEDSVKLACPVCYQPLVQTGRKGLHPLVVDASSFRCESCHKPYMSMTGIIDLTISGGAQDLEEALPSGVALFQNPLLAYVYERGYRDVFDIFNFPGYNEEFKMAQVFLKSAKGGTILDVSCGGGGFTQRFLISGDYETVIASDYSEAMLENCRGFLEKDSAVDSKKVVLIRADVARLPFATSSLAAVHAGAAIHCWPQPTMSVAEICRVLKPGGVFVASTFLVPIPPSPLAGIFMPIRRTIMQLGLPFQWWTESEVRGITEACGLVGWQSIRRGAYIVFAVHKPV
ncbi:unnamed protein product [Sphagnum compactum]